MPAVSQSQQRLMAAAEHGATFPLARKLRRTMSHQQLHDFAATKRRGLPVRIPTKKRRGSLAARVQALRGAGKFKAA